MTSIPDDFDSRERDARDAVTRALDGLRGGDSTCPSAQLLRAADQDALPQELKAGIDAHRSTCTLCQTVSAAIRELPSPAVMTEPESSRILASVAGPQRPAQSPIRLAILWKWRPVLAAAGLLVVVGLLAWRRPWMPPPAPAGSPSAAPAASASPSADRAFELDKPPLTMTVAALTWRGRDGRRLAEDLAPAYEAYRADEFAAAARDLARLAAVYPDAFEVHFYLGVCRLFLHDPAAVAALERASTLADEPMRPEASWYLGLAYQRSGRADAARARFAELCRGASAYASRACTAQHALDRVR